LHFHPFPAFFAAMQVMRFQPKVQGGGSFRNWTGEADHVLLFLPVTQRSVFEA